jgi:hypothetical protein
VAAYKQVIVHYSHLCAVPILLPNPPKPLALLAFLSPISLVYFVGAENKLILRDIRPAAERLEEEERLQLVPCECVLWRLSYYWLPISLPLPTTKLDLSYILHISQPAICSGTTTRTSEKTYCRKTGVPDLYFPS